MNKLQGINLHGIKIFRSQDSLSYTRAPGNSDRGIDPSGDFKWKLMQGSRGFPWPAHQSTRVLLTLGNPSDWTI